MEKRANNATDIAAEFKDYAYAVSHDLSAPVRAMVEFSRMLVEENAAALSADGREYLSLIVENGEKLQAMMDGLLQYSRLNTMAKPFTSVSIARLVEDCRTVLAPLIAQTGATFHIGALPTLTVDMEQVMLLFHALIHNAMTYRREGRAPHIVIGAEEKNGVWVFTVADNGIGIAEAHREKIFKLFRRLHTDEECAGIGVGLTLAEKIVRRHGGSIGVEQNPNGGSIFTFTLG